MCRSEFFFVHVRNRHETQMKFDSDFFCFQYRCMQEEDDEIETEEPTQENTSPISTSPPRCNLESATPQDPSTSSLRVSTPQVASTSRFRAPTPRDEVSKVAKHFWFLLLFFEFFYN